MAGGQKRKIVRTALCSFSQHSRYNPPMRISDGGKVPWGIILVQVVLIAGLIAFLKFYLPHRAKAATEREFVQREQKINALFQNAVEEDDSKKIPVSVDGEIEKRYPQKLRLALTPQQVEDSLGVPGKDTTDFQGGEHLTWWGATHRLEAAFNAGRLYCLTLEDRSTGHGVMVFENPYQWHPY
jgi:hypothetical protein